MIHIVDLHDPKRVEKLPNDIIVLFESSNFIQDEFTITHVELRHYVEKNDAVLGPYSLITSYIETDRGSIEMIYDEGFRGENSLVRTVQFLTSNLGVSGLILRSIIALRDKIENNTF